MFITTSIPQRVARYFSSTTKSILKLRVGAVSLPHPRKQEEGEDGEDSYFVSEPLDNRRCFGVADGVADWWVRGVDAGAFSRELMEQANVAFQGVPFLPPREIMAIAHKQVLKRGVVGSSTATVLTFDGERHTLECASLGDSGCVVVRDKQVVFQSKIQEHDFGCPLQLSSVDPDHPSAFSDSAIQSSVETVQMRDQDLVLVCTDGVFDNVDMQAAAVDLWRMRENAAQYLADILARHALENSRYKNKDTPWSRSASEHFGLIYRGGKMDDITVVLAKVLEG